MYHIQVIGNEPRRLLHFTFSGSVKAVIKKAYDVTIDGDTVTIEADNGSPVTRFQVHK